MAARSRGPVCATIGIIGRPGIATPHHRAPTATQLGGGRPIYAAHMTTDPDRSKSAASPGHARAAAGRHVRPGAPALLAPLDMSCRSNRFVRFGPKGSRRSTLQAPQDPPPRQREAGDRGQTSASTPRAAGGAGPPLQLSTHRPPRAHRMPPSRRALCSELWEFPAATTSITALAATTPRGSAMEYRRP
jgi:hypothetical protein